MHRRRDRGHLPRRGLAHPGHLPTPATCRAAACPAPAGSQPTPVITTTPTATRTRQVTGIASLQS
ncbi:MAG TPA: hypothetical protein VKS82_13500 [Streptosporangiaceae bacterium]|nr:hypothetical protein [Streptosporangiaceae bacterium]